MSTLDKIRYNGTDYNIGGSSEEIYSTEEQVIGKWIDGKPLYRKVVYIEPVTFTGLKSIEHGISDIDYIVNVTGSRNGTPFNHVRPDSLAAGYGFNMDTVYFHLRTGQERTISGYAIVEYTKTTD